MDFRETLYVQVTGRGHGVAATHACWYCKGYGYICRAAIRCTPPHE